MITLKCCGQTYRADEKHVGYSIRCTVCHRVIPIGKSEIAKNPISRSILKSSEAKRRFPRNWLIPILGALALVAGVSLTIVNLRTRKLEVPHSEVSSKASAPVSASNVNAPRPPAHPSPSLSISQTPIVAAQNASPSPPLQSNTNDRAESPYDTILAAVVPVPTEAPPTVRYGNGSNLMRPQNVDGRGVLTISNNTDFDAIVKLAESKSGRPSRSVYIRAYGNAEISKITAGDYIVKFALGMDYNAAAGLFNRPQTFKQFDESFEFREYKEAGYIHWSEFSITLNPVEGGTAAAKVINERDFLDH